MELVAVLAYVINPAEPSAELVSKQVPVKVSPVVSRWKQHEHELPFQSRPAAHALKVAFIVEMPWHPELMQIYPTPLYKEEEALRHSLPEQEDEMEEHRPQVEYIQ